jgi:hypothetical protein
VNRMSDRGEFYLVACGTGVRGDGIAVDFLYP